MRATEPKGDRAKLLRAEIEKPSGDEQIDALRGVLIARLRGLAPEVEAAIVAKGQSIEPTVGTDPEGLAVLRASAHAVIEAIVAAIEQGEDWVPTLPPAVAAQVRHLARNDVALDAAMRGFYAVVSVLLEFLIEEIADLPTGALPYLVGIQSKHGDRLMSAVSAEYESEVARLDRSPEKRIAECVEKLLAGEPADAADLGYDLQAWHLGVMAVGAKADLFVRSLAERLGCRLLLLPRSADTAWAWLGANRAIPFAELARLLPSDANDSVSLAVGETRQGLEGWRLTHREAQAALPVLLRQSQRLVRSSDVVLLAAALQSETMQRSLVDTYLRPLSERRDARSLLETLHVYFSLDCNAASAAAALGVNRHTVQRRLRRVEKIIDRPLDTCRPEINVALRIEQLDLKHQ